jgi:hypothetical protein
LDSGTYARAGEFGAGRGALHHRLVVKETGTECLRRSSSRRRSVASGHLPEQEQRPSAVNRHRSDCLKAQVPLAEDQHSVGDLFGRSARGVRRWPRSRRAIRGLFTTIRRAMNHPATSEQRLDELFGLRHDLQTIRTSAAQAHQSYTGLLETVGAEGLLAVDEAWWRRGCRRRTRARWWGCRVPRRAPRRTRSAPLRG